MKLIIAGSRHIVNYKEVLSAIEIFKDNNPDFDITEVVCGDAPGADTLGEQWATSNGIPVRHFPADWNDIEAPGAVVKRTKTNKLYNAAAGFNRNAAMAKYADGLIAIWDGASKGTANTIDIMKKLNKITYVHLV